MRNRSHIVLGLLWAATLTFALAFNLAAQTKSAKPPKAPKMSNVQGRVEMINKDTSTITIANGTLKREVSYNADTKFLYGHSKKNTPGSLDQVKNGNFMSCAGAAEAGKARITAKECVYRETK